MLCICSKYLTGYCCITIITDVALQTVKEEEVYYCCLIGIPQLHMIAYDSIYWSLEPGAW